MSNPNQMYYIINDRGELAIAERRGELGISGMRISSGRFKIEPTRDPEKPRLRVRQDNALIERQNKDSKLIKEILGI